MQHAPLKQTIPMERFLELDLRVGTIVEVGEVEGSTKLVALRVDFGNHERTILSGMKQERDDLGELVGRQGIFLLNIPQKRMFGTVSEGMVVDIGYEDGLLPALVVPERPMPNGARVG